jgi:hypothetical protein
MLLRLVSMTAVPRDAGVVDEHVDGAVRRLCGGKCFDCGLPVADIADRRVELEAQGLLLGQPFGMVARGAAACDDSKAVFEKALADGSSDATHASGDICNFLAHEIFLDVCEAKA